MSELTTQQHLIISNKTSLKRMNLKVRLVYPTGHEKKK